MELIKLDSGLWLCVIAKWCACIGATMGEAIANAKAEYEEVGHE